MGKNKSEKKSARNGKQAKKAKVETESRNIKEIFTRSSKGAEVMWILEDLIGFIENRTAHGLSWGSYRIHHPAVLLRIPSGCYAPGWKRG
ncbi:hypothetical protein DITRI_Ditri20bG0115900 [Diplodiscus trichospermus]